MAISAEELAALFEKGLGKKSFAKIMEAAVENSTLLDSLTGAQEAALKKFASKNPAAAAEAFGKLAESQARTALAEELGVDPAAAKKEVDWDLTRKPREFEEAMTERYKRMGIKNFADDMGFDKESFDESVGKHVRITEDKYGDAKVELRRKSALDDIKGEIDKLHRDKERLLERDPSKTKEIGAIDKKLEVLGKKAQREIYDARESIDKYAKGLDDAHAKKMYKLEDRQREITDALDSIDHKGKRGARKIILDEELKKSLLIETDHGQYRIDEDGVSLAGRNKSGKAVEVKDLKEGQIKGIREKAIERVEQRYDAIRDAAKERHEVVQKHLTSASEHINGEIKTEVSTKTGMGEWTGKTASKVTPGGVQAASKGIMTEVEYEKLSPTEKFGAKTKAVFKSGPMGMVQTGLMALGGIDGFRRIIEGGSDIMSGDPERQNGWSKVFIGVPEVAVAGWIGQMGGRNKVLGV
ncbi:MAG: hypothetical protein SFX19_03950 [Alphaproteobacteria bacterium]|nr:hypothetical protein [Alphaproteobacteria bacterium]